MDVINFDADNGGLVALLRDCIDLAWLPDSHQVDFDSTVMFGPYYDYSGIDGTGRCEFLGAVECIVWPSGSRAGAAAWSAYCSHGGRLWFELFDSCADAKEACMRMIDQLLPDHPAVRARAAIAEITRGGGGHKHPAAALAPIAGVTHGRHQGRTSDRAATR